MPLQRVLDKHQRLACAGRTLLRLCGLCVSETRMSPSTYQAGPSLTPGPERELSVTSRGEQVSASTSPISHFHFISVPLPTHPHTHPGKMLALCVVNTEKFGDCGSGEQKY